MRQSLFFEDLHVGDSWQSRARTITETDVVNFAALTGDYDPLHVDREYAKQTPFGRPIAHGLLGLSFVAGLGSCFPMINTVAFVAVRNWEFLRPAFIGDTVHARIKVVELIEKGRRRGTVLWQRQLVNQAGAVVQEGIFETLVAKYPPGQARREEAAANTERTKAKARKTRSTRAKGKEKLA